MCVDVSAAFKKTNRFVLKEHVSSNFPKILINRGNVSSQSWRRSNLRGIFDVKRRSVNFSYTSSHRSSVLKYIRALWKYSNVCVFIRCCVPVRSEIPVLGGYSTKVLSTKNIVFETRMIVCTLFNNRCVSIVKCLLLLIYDASLPNWNFIVFVVFGAFLFQII